MQVSIEEALLEELELAIDVLNKEVSASTPYDSLDCIENIISTMRTSGICKEDGKALARFGIITDELAEKLTEYRSDVGLDELGLEVDRADIIGKLTLLAIGALASVISFVLYKLFKFFADVFKKEDNVLGPVGEKPNLSSVKVKSKMSDNYLSDVLKTLEEAFEKVIAMSANEFFDNEARKSYSFLEYPTEFSSISWTEVAFKLASDAAEFLADDVKVGELTIEDASKELEEIKDKPRAGLTSLHNQMSSWLPKVFEEPESDKGDDLNEQLRFFMRWKNESKWAQRRTGEVAKKSIREIGVINPDDIDKAEKTAKELEKTVEAMRKSFTKLKINDRRGRQVASSYLKYSAEEPTRFITATLQRFVVPYLTSAGKVAVKTNKAADRTAKMLGVVMDYVLKANSAADDQTLNGKYMKDVLDTLGAEFKRVYDDGKPLPNELHVYEPILQDGKAKDITSLIVAMMRADMGVYK